MKGAANSVPAAAVRRRPLALLGITGLKERRRSGKYFVKAPASIRELLGILSLLRQVGVTGTLGGAVKCVDI